uniref:BTB/POZ domain-containing protein 8 n=1 Tax=Leptobrachium leishanense TaxID=445787 RepID=A0A8C5R2M7_9ANUR
MAARGPVAPAGLKVLDAKDVSERRRLRDLLGEQLSTDIRRLLNDELHVDMVICVGQAMFKAHKVVLLARTPRFYSYVTRCPSMEKVILENIKPSEIELLLKVVYSSCWSVTDLEEHILCLMDQNWMASIQDQNDGSQPSLQSSAPSAMEDLNDNACLHNCNGPPNAPVRNEPAGPKMDDVETASVMGKELLSLFQRSCCPDVVIQIEDTQFQAHKAILSARSSYFAAMLSGCWAESSQDLINLQGIHSVDMTVMMHFIYGGVLDLPEKVDPGRILSIADMYGLEGLKEVAIYVLKRDYCKFFHKPVVGVQQSVLECLSIAYSLGEEQLLNSCMRWIEKYFVKCWSEKSFASLSVELQKQCLAFLVQSLAQRMSSRPYLLEHVFNEIEKSISFQNSTSLFMALDDLFNMASENEMGFTCEIHALRDKLWTFLLHSFYAVRHTEGWKLMRPDDQQKIQAAAVDKGDDRRLTKKPIFTSSQQSRPKIAILKENSLSAAEHKRLSEGDLSRPRKMKSEAIGAPGLSSNVGRNSSAKGKDDDVKGKDSKKTITKGTKDPKPVEKAAVVKAKITTKIKLESNSNAKTDCCASKGESAGAAKPLSSGRLGARPKVSNGGLNSQAKVRSVKKTVTKELSSPVKGPGPNVKSVLSNGEHSSCNMSLEESNHDAATDELQSSANGSPQSSKTVKNTVDGCKESDMSVKSKSPAKVTNGAPIKRKVNEAECRTDANSSSTKKIPVNGGADPGLQKKRVVKLSSCASQRPKSAPAALSKKQGSQCDGATPSKSIGPSKQPEAKPDAKLMNQSMSADKAGPASKKNGKVMHGSTSKTGSQVAASTKQGASGNKCSTVSPKDPKQKVSSGSHSSKVSNLKHKKERTGSPAASRSGHDQQSSSLEQAHQQAGGSKNHVSLEKDCKLSGLSEQQCSEDPSLTVYEGCLENSIGNQNPMIQKPNIEHCSCQENTMAASAELYASDSKRGLTDVNDVTLAEEHSVLNILNDQKLDGKNICDSENSKCADSSSESELCSVKEVERNMKEEGTSSPVHTSKQNSESPPAGRNNREHFVNCVSERSFPECPRDLNIAETYENRENGDLQFTSHWNNHSGTLHERESPESESGSASTSSDDIKPRSEDYDAGGSQDDDGSNERGISKCSTMRCHDFLGRSSSDTSTPEELKGYDGSLRIDVKVKKESSADLFRVNSTSDDEAPRKRSEMWLHRDAPKHSVHPKALCSSIQFPQEMEHLSSSADETEDERSEAENAVDKGLEDIPSQPFQGIVNLAFDDMAEIETEGQVVSSNKMFTRSLLLSVDECEELGSDEGEPNPSQARKGASLTPAADVFEKSPNEHAETKYSECSQKECGSTEPKLPDADKRSGKGKIISDVEPNSGNLMGGVALTMERPLGKDHNHSEVHDVAESYMYKGFYNHSEGEYKSQTRPCHLDLYTTESPSAMQRFCPPKTLNACKNDILDYQGKENHESPTESFNTALPPGHIDGFDSLAQTCIYEHRPSNSLSPIYEMDPREGIEQLVKTQAKLVDLEIEDQQFVDGDWTLLRQLLEEHGSDVDVINSVPEDLSLAQYLINQTLRLSRENSKSQGKAHVNTSSKWGDLSSPFDDSTSATMTSFSPDDSSPHGEWTILELETHH